MAVQDDRCMNEKRPAETVFSTPWFEVVADAGSVGHSSSPYYFLRLSDYVCVVAVTDSAEVILVRQYRPAAARVTLELPAGHVDPGESPEASARRELEEETGFTAARWQLLGKLEPDTGRLSNTLWCYLALDARLNGPRTAAEQGIEVERCRVDALQRKVRDGAFDHALHVAALHLAWISGKLPVEGGFSSRSCC
jgi:8-oxo-dGTP pyrophosphatase MutT (NUDIX family)